MLLEVPECLDCSHRFNFEPYEDSDRLQPLFLVAAGVSEVLSLILLAAMMPLVSKQEVIITSHLSSGCGQSSLAEALGDTGPRSPRPSD